MQKNKWFGHVLLACLMIFYAFPSFAGDETLFNTVNLQAQAEREIPNDQMIVLLATEHEGSDTSGLVAKINTDMQWALGIINKYSAVVESDKKLSDLSHIQETDSYWLACESTNRDQEYKYC